MTNKKRKAGKRIASPGPLPEDRQSSTGAFNRPSAYPQPSRHSEPSQPARSQPVTTNQRNFSKHNHKIKKETPDPQSLASSSTTIKSQEAPGIPFLAVPETMSQTHSHDAPQSANKRIKIEHLDDDVSKTSVIHKVETSLSPIKSAAAELSPPIGDVKGKSAEKLLDEPIKGEHPASAGPSDETLHLEQLWRKVQQNRSKGDPTTFHTLIMACLEEQVHKLSKECTGADANATNQLRDDERLRAAVSCAICLEILAVPHIIQCGQCQLGHSYCFHCLREWCSQQTDTRRTKCPTCRAILSTPPVSSSVLDALVDMALDRLPMSERETQRARIDVHKEASKLVSAPWKDACPPSVLVDVADQVTRCSICSWEILGSECVGCGAMFDLPLNSETDQVGSTSESESGEIGTPAETQDPSSLECPLASFPDGDSNDGPLAVLFSDSGSSVYDEGDGFVVDDEGDVSVRDSCSETFSEDSFEDVVDAVSSSDDSSSDEEEINIIRPRALRRSIIDDDLELTSEANSVAQVESPLPNNQSALVKEESKDESSDDESSSD
ncbi:hypothetical protein BSLG_003803 [Batrachochytrium salamandrivorans]|nr:hypothetical protein BSLG_003803 [Batrachochytrium salamandrivorans]